LWFALVTVAHLWGEGLVHIDRRVRIDAPPLAASFVTRFSFRAVLPLGVAILVLAGARRAGRSLSWPALLWAAAGAAAAWALSLALFNGVHDLTAPNHHLTQYAYEAARVHHPAAFLRGFAAHIAGYKPHVKAHPPGFVLLLWLVARMRISPAGAEVGLCVAGGAAAVPAVLVALRRMAGEPWARAAAPFLVLTPAAVWFASSADAFFAGVGAWAVALLVLAATAGQRRSGDRLAVGGGLLFGLTLYLSYGLVLLAIIPAGVAAARRNLRPLALAAGGLAPVAMAFRIGGFAWLHGLRATLPQYAMSAARYRPQSYFWFGNLGAFAIVLGPAVGPAMARLRDRGVWLLVGLSGAAVLLADASALSKAEVERIWLPFAPWIMAAAASFWEAGRATEGRSDAGRGWLALSAATGLFLAFTLRLP
jgi:hypothetical protein